MFKTIYFNGKPFNKDLACFSSEPKEALVLLNTIVREYVSPNANLFEVDGDKGLSISQAFARVLPRMYKAGDKIAPDVDAPFAITDAQTFQPKPMPIPAPDYLALLCAYFRIHWGFPDAVSTFLAKRIIAEHTQHVTSFDDVFAHTGIINAKSSQPVFSFYKDAELKPERGKVSYETFVEYINETYGHSAKRLHQWLSALVTPEAKRISWAIIFCSQKRGTFKSSFAMLARNLVTRSYSVEIHPSGVDSEFNGECAGKRLIAYEELPPAKKDQTAWLANLKAQLTAPEYAIHGKGKQRYFLPNVGQVLICTNTSYAFQAMTMDESRRFFVAELTRANYTPEENKDFYKKFQTLLTVTDEEHYFDSVIYGLRQYYKDHADEIPYDFPNETADDHLRLSSLIDSSLTPFEIQLLEAAETYAFIPHAYLQTLSEYKRGGGNIPKSIEKVGLVAKELRYVTATGVRKKIRAYAHKSFDFAKCRKNQAAYLLTYTPKPNFDKFDNYLGVAFRSMPADLKQCPEIAVLDILPYTYIDEMDFRTMGLQGFDPHSLTMKTFGDVDAAEVELSKARAIDNEIYNANPNQVPPLCEALGSYMLGLRNSINFRKGVK